MRSFHVPGVLQASCCSGYPRAELSRSSLNSFRQPEIALSIRARQRNLRTSKLTKTRRSSSVPRHPEPRPKISACERTPTSGVSVARHAADWQHSHRNRRRAIIPGRRRPNCSLRMRCISSMPAIVIAALRNCLNPSVTQKRCLTYQIPQAQLEAEIPAHTQHDDLTVELSTRKQLAEALKRLRPRRLRRLVLTHSGKESFRHHITVDTGRIAVEFRGHLVALFQVEAGSLNFHRV